MAPATELLYLSSQAIEETNTPLGEVQQAIEQVFLAKARGDTTLVAKSGFRAGKGAFFHAMPAAVSDPPLAGLKWVSVGNENAALGLPSIAAIVVLNDAVTGLPLAVL